MHRRIWVSVAAMAVGTGLLVGAAVAAPTKSSKAGAAAAPALKKGGTLKINISGTDIDDIDPQIAYGTTSWNAEYVTALKLVNYPDAKAPRGKQLRPEGASRWTVSKNGRVYTFFIKKGYRFSDGSKVTAKNYAYALNRALDKDLQSPAFQFISDAAATNIVGAARVRANGGNASGIKTKGNRLIVTLTKPSPAFLAELSMPFFQATSTKLSRSKKVIGVSGNALPSAGPYYVASREPDRTMVLKRNKYYKGPRPHYVNQINFTMNVNLESGFNQVLAGQVDYQEGIPPTETAGLRSKYGVNKSRFFVYGGSCVRYMAMNMSRPLFKNNLGLRKAVNFAINRTALNNQYGVLGGTPWDQILPPVMPGFKQANIYPSRPNLARAKTLAKNKLRGGKITMFHGVTGVGPQLADLTENSLKALGFSVTRKGYRGFDIYTAAGRRTSDHDITVGTGWCKDYPDPYDFINVLLYGGNIQAENNNNLAYFNTPAYNKLMNSAAKMTGAKRLKTYGNLDINIARNAAPWASWQNVNNRFFIGSKVNPKSFIYQPAYENPDYAILSLK